MTAAGGARRVLRPGRTDSSAVNTASGDSTWEVSRRFSSFLALHKQLAQVSLDPSIYRQSHVKRIALALERVIRVLF